MWKTAFRKLKDGLLQSLRQHAETQAVTTAAEKAARQIGKFPVTVREKPFHMRPNIRYFAPGNITKLIFTMKRLATIITALVAFMATAGAMSYEQARDQALFLTDKMAYELNLTEEQYDAAYEVNLDYLMSVNTPDDLYDVYWRQRNLDLSYILLDWQYRAFCAAAYFYRPLYWTAGVWHFAIYSRYPRRHFYYFGRPHIYVTYRGGHSWRHNGGRSWYKGRTFHHGAGIKGHGLRDRFDRGDFHKKGSNRPGKPEGRHENFAGQRGDNRPQGFKGRPQRGNDDKRRPGVGFNGNHNNIRNNRESSTRKTARPADVRRRNFGAGNAGKPAGISTQRKPSATFTPKRNVTRPSVRQNSRPARPAGGGNRTGGARGGQAKGGGRSGGGHFGGHR